MQKKITKKQKDKMKKDETARLERVKNAPKTQERQKDIERLTIIEMEIEHLQIAIDGNMEIRKRMQDINIGIKYRIDELKQFCKEFGVKSSGVKKDLIDRFIAEIENLDRIIGEQEEEKKELKDEREALKKNTPLEEDHQPKPTAFSSKKDYRDSKVKLDYFQTNHPGFYDDLKPQIGVDQIFQDFGFILDAIVDGIQFTPDTLDVKKILEYYETKYNGNDDTVRRRLQAIIRLMKFHKFPQSDIDVISKEKNISSTIASGNYKTAKALKESLEELQKKYEEFKSLIGTIKTAKIKDDTRNVLLAYLYYNTTQCINSDGNITNIHFPQYLEFCKTNIYKKYDGPNDKPYICLTKRIIFIHERQKTNQIIDEGYPITSDEAFNFYTNLLGDSKVYPLAGNSYGIPPDYKGDTKSITGKFAGFICSNRNKYPELAGSELIRSIQANINISDEQRKSIINFYNNAKKMGHSFGTHLLYLAKKN